MTHNAYQTENSISIRDIAGNLKPPFSIKKKNIKYSLKLYWAGKKIHYCNRHHSHWLTVEIRNISLSHLLNFEGHFYVLNNYSIIRVNFSKHFVLHSLYDIGKHKKSVSVNNWDIMGNVISVWKKIFPDERWKILPVDNSSFKVKFSYAT